MCSDCNKFYIEQTRRSFTKYDDYIKVINHLFIKSDFAEHMLCIGHKYTNIQTNLQMLCKKHKGLKLNTLEQFEIYKYQKMKFQMTKSYITTIYYITSPHNRTPLPPPLNPI